MASRLNVDQINNAAGTSGISHDASTGKAAFPNSVTIPNGATMPAGSMVQVQNSFGDTIISIANSGTGRIYADLLTISYTPISSSNKIVLLGTSGFGSNASETSRGAFGVIFEVNGTNHDFGNYPWYDSSLVYPYYPPDTTISKTIAVPTGSAFDIKLKGYSYNESVDTMTPRFYKYSLTVMEIAQ